MADFYAKLASKFNEDGTYNSRFVDYARVQRFVEHIALMNGPATTEGGATAHGQRFEFAFAEFMGDDDVNLSKTQNAKWDAIASDAALISMKTTERPRVQMSYLLERAEFVENDVRFVIMQYDKKKGLDKGGKLFVMDFEKAKWNSMISALVDQREGIRELVDKWTNEQNKTDTFKTEKLAEMKAQFKPIKAKQKEQFDGLFEWTITSSKSAFSPKIETTLSRFNPLATARLQDYSKKINPYQYQYPTEADKDASQFIFMGILPDEWLSTKNSDAYRAIMEFEQTKPKKATNFWFQHNKTKIRQIEGKE